jgi:hypothetical protein
MKTLEMTPQVGQVWLDCDNRHKKPRLLKIDWIEVRRDSQYARDAQRAAPTT